jgi:hypothetical protein
VGVRRRAVPWAVAGLCLLIGAVAAATHAYLEEASYWQVPLREPFPIIEGNSLLRRFVLTSTCGYELDVELQRPLPEGTSRRLLSTESPVDIQWQVLEAGRPVAEGSRPTRGVIGTPSTLGQRIGRFSGEAGHQYELHAESMATVPEFANASPVLKIIRESSAPRVELEATRSVSGRYFRPFSCSRRDSAAEGPFRMDAARAIWCTASSMTSMPAPRSISARAFW